MSVFIVGAFLVLMFLLWIVGRLVDWHEACPFCGSRVHAVLSTVGIFRSCGHHSVR